MTQAINLETKWYKQFWPWFLIFLPASAVIASIATIILATNNADSLVVDDYYKKAMQINRDLSKIEYAKKVGLVGDLSFNSNQIALVIKAQKDSISFAPVLNLMLIHPTDSNKDIRINLIEKQTKEKKDKQEKLEEHYYFSQSMDLQNKKILTGAWYVRLLSPDNKWQLNGKIRNNKKIISLYAD